MNLGRVSSNKLEEANRQFFCRRSRLCPTIRHRGLALQLAASPVGDRTLAAGNFGGVSFRLGSDAHWSRGDDPVAHPAQSAPRWASSG